MGRIRPDNSNLVARFFEPILSCPNVAGADRIACGCAAFMRLRRKQGLLTRATDSAARALIFINILN